MEPTHIRILCPECRAEGKARVEMLGRRVRCKHCSHTFRVEPAQDGQPPRAARAGKSSREALRLRVEALEREVRAIRRSLPSPVPSYPRPEPEPEPEAPPGTVRPEPDAAELRGRLDRMVEAARQAEIQAAARQLADAERIDELRREVTNLRDRVAHAGGRDGRGALEPSVEAPLPDNSRAWPG